MECGGARFPIGHGRTDRNSLGSAAILHIKRHLSRVAFVGTIKLETSLQRTAMHLYNDNRRYWIHSSERAAIEMTRGVKR